MPDPILRSMGQQVRFDNIARSYSASSKYRFIASGNIAESENGVKNTSKQSYRTRVRMSTKDYEVLKKESAAAGLSANGMSGDAVGDQLPCPVAEGGSLGSHPLFG